MNEQDNLIQCRASNGVALNASQPWEAGKPVSFIYAPAGVHNITAGFRKGETITICVENDEQTAKDLQASFDHLTATEPQQEPFSDEDHDAKKATLRFPAAVTKFSWGDIKGNRGIIVQAEPTSYGAESVNGKVYRSWSPEFATDADYSKARNKNGHWTFPDGVRGSESNPARIVGVSFVMGALTNRPAFRAMPPVKAKKAEAIQAAQSKEYREWRSGAKDATDAAHSATWNAREAAGEKEAYLHNEAADAHEHAAIGHGHAALETDGILQKYHEHMSDFHTKMAEEHERRAINPNNPKTPPGSIGASIPFTQLLSTLQAALPDREIANIEHDCGNCFTATVIANDEAQSVNFILAEDGSIELDGNFVSASVPENYDGECLLNGEMVKAGGSGSGPRNKNITANNLSAKAESASAKAKELKTAEAHDAAAYAHYRAAQANFKSSFPDGKRKGEEHLKKSEYHAGISDLANDDPPLSGSSPEYLTVNGERYILASGMDPDCSADEAVKLGARAIKLSRYAKTQAEHEEAATAHDEAGQAHEDAETGQHQRHYDKADWHRAQAKKVKSSAAETIEIDGEVYVKAGDAYKTLKQHVADHGADSLLGKTLVANKDIEHVAIISGHPARSSNFYGGQKIKVHGKAGSGWLVGYMVNPGIAEHQSGLSGQKVEDPKPRTMRGIEYGVHPEFSGEDWNVEGSNSVKSSQPDSITVDGETYVQATAESELTLTELRNQVLEAVQADPFYSTLNASVPDIHRDEENDTWTAVVQAEDKQYKVPFEVNWEAGSVQLSGKSSEVVDATVYAADQVYFNGEAVVKAIGNSELDAIYAAHKKVNVEERIKRAKSLGMADWAIEGLRKELEDHNAGKINTFKRKTEKSEPIFKKEDESHPYHGVAKRLTERFGEEEGFEPGRETYLSFRKAAEKDKVQAIPNRHHEGFYKDYEDREKLGLEKKYPNISREIDKQYGSSASLDLNSIYANAEELDGEAVVKAAQEPNEQGLKEHARLQADTAREWHHKTKKNADGTPMRVRRNGKTQTWKSRPGEFRIPVKYGLYEYGNITHDTAGDWNPGNGMVYGSDASTNLNSIYAKLSDEESAAKQSAEASRVVGEALDKIFARVGANGKPAAAKN